MPSFDAAAPELVAAHLILALYWTHQMDSGKINRCIGLAHQSNDIISDSPGALVASLTFVSVILYDAKVSNKSAAGDERLAEESLFDPSGKRVPEINSLIMQHGWHGRSSC